MLENSSLSGTWWKNTITNCFLQCYKPFSFCYFFYSITFLRSLKTQTKNPHDISLVKIILKLVNFPFAGIILNISEKSRYSLILADFPDTFFSKTRIFSRSSLRLEILFQINHNFDEVSENAKALTPVPGGVGPMTIACLLKNTIDCFKRSQI